MHNTFFIETPFRFSASFRKERALHNWLRLPSLMGVAGSCWELLGDKAVVKGSKMVLDGWGVGIVEEE